MIRFVLSALFAFATSVPTMAQDIVADLSQARVSIDAQFSGSSILVFGAIRHAPGFDALANPIEHPISVIVTVSGPSEQVTVRKKDRVAGIWINREALEIDAAPALYKVATSAPLEQILNETDDLRHKITIPKAIRSVGKSGQVSDFEAFTEALIRIRKDEGLYEVQEGAVRLAEQTLFRTDIDLPANLVEGEYDARIFLSQDKKIVADFHRILDVRKVGLERWIYNLAQEQALLYGVLSLVIAVAAGWGASAAFRLARGQG